MQFVVRFREPLSKCFLEPHHAGQIVISRDTDTAGSTLTINFRLTSAPLQATESVRLSPQDVAPLAEPQLPAIVAEALSRWDAVNVRDSLSATNFIITDLPGPYLGLAELDTIYVALGIAGNRFQSGINGPQNAPLDAYEQSADWWSARGR